MTAALRDRDCRQRLKKIPTSKAIERYQEYWAITSTTRTAGSPSSSPARCRSPGLPAAAAMSMIKKVRSRIPAAATVAYTTALGSGMT